MNVTNFVYRFWFLHFEIPLIDNKLNISILYMSFYVLSLFAVSFYRLYFGLLPWYISYLIPLLWAFSFYNYFSEIVEARKIIMSGQTYKTRSSLMPLIMVVAISYSLIQFIYILFRW